MRDVPTNLGRLPREIEFAIFRIVQESLAKVHRHSGSASATVRISRIPTEILLAVSDRGKGFSPERRVARSSELSVVRVSAACEKGHSNWMGRFALKCPTARAPPCWSTCRFRNNRNVRGAYKTNTVSPVLTQLVAESNMQTLSLETKEVYSRVAQIHLVGQNSCICTKAVCTISPRIARLSGLPEADYSLTCFAGGCAPAVVHPWNWFKDMGTE